MAELVPLFWVTLFVILIVSVILWKKRLSKTEVYKSADEAEIVVREKFTFSYEEALEFDKKFKEALLASYQDKTHMVFDFIREDRKKILQIRIDSPLIHR